jgi:nucleoside-diphosphate-sugar epimerase
MNILITGISGFVGSNLVDYFISDHLIQGLDISSPKVDGDIKIHSWDSIESVTNFDSVIHLAGKAHDTKSKSLAQSYFDINTGLTKKIFDKFLESDAVKFIYFSSIKAAAEKVIEEPLTEDVIPSPVGPYGESKLKAEEYILSRIAENSELIKGKKVFILRPCMIHGPRNKGNLNLLYKVVSKGIPWPLGSFENKRSFTSIDNLLFIINEIINKDIEPGTYNICDDDPLSTNELIELISKSVGKTKFILNINRGLINYLAKMGDKLHLPFNSFRLQKLTENYVVSNDKIKRAIGVDRLPVSASQGMKRTLDSFKINI